MNQILKLDDFIYDDESRDALRELYPDGFQNFSLDGITLSCSTKAELFICVFDKPAVSRDKWGIWGEDYNALILHFYCWYFKKESIQNWQNNLAEEAEYRCNAEISACRPANDFGMKDEKDITLRFWGDDWNVELITKILIFQDNHITALYATDDPLEYQ